MGRSTGGGNPYDKRRVYERIHVSATTGFSGSNPNVAFPAGGTKTILIRTWVSVTSRWER